MSLKVEALIRRGRLCASSIGSITAAAAGLRAIGADGKIRPVTAKGYEHRFVGASDVRRKAAQR